MTLPVSRNDIVAAYARIKDHVRHTPLMHLGPNALGLDCSVTFKLEFLQHAGSFKTRGAFNSLLSMAPNSVGITAASGGNHGASVAFAARKLGIKAKIFVPEISSPIKIATIRLHGADVVIGGARYDDAQKACNAYAAETGAMIVHPFDAPGTLAGQGTAALEWDADGATPDSVLIACGGGGLIGGMAAWWQDKAQNGEIKVVGVEPEGSRCLYAALESNGPVAVDVQSIAADALGARMVGQLPYTIAKAAVDHVALVSDEAIMAAQDLLWRDFRIASEAGGAAALAALLSGAYKPKKGEHVGVLLCGANVDPARFA